MLLRTKAMLLGCTLMLGACEPKPAEPATPLATTSFAFNLVDTAGVPIAGVQVVEVVDGNEELLGQTADGGQISVLEHETGNLTVTFTKTGYAPQVWTGDLMSPQSERIVMIQREAAIVFDAGEYADVDGKDGASVEVPANAFLDVDGLLYNGEISVNITPVDIASDATEAGAFPGSFNAVLESGAEQPLITYGTVEYHFTDENGNELQLAEGQTATIEIPIYTPIHPDGTVINIGDVIPFWYLDEATGIWYEDGAGTVVASASSPTGLAQRGEVSHFTWWNCDVSPNPATVTIETTLPDYADRTYRLEYKATPLGSRFSARTDEETYLGGGLATYSQYIPQDTKVKVEVILYRFLDDSLSTFVAVARDGGTYYFSQGDDVVLEFDFTDHDSASEVFEPNPTPTVFDLAGTQLAEGDSLILIPSNNVNFTLAQIDGLEFSLSDSPYQLLVDDGSAWLQDLLTINGLGQIVMSGVVPEFNGAAAALTLVDANGEAALTFTVNFVAGEILNISVNSGDVVLQSGTSIQFVAPEIVGGYPEYTVTLLPNSFYLTNVVTTSGSLVDGFELTGMSEGRTSVQYRVYDQTLNSAISEVVNVLVLDTAPQLAEVADIQYLIGRNLNVQPVVTDGIVTEWSYRGELPSGVTFDSENGSIIGTLSAVGTYNISIVAANMLGEAVSEFLINVNPEPVLPLTATELDLEALTGVQANIWSLTTGNLPQGLELNSSTGVINGAAQEAGVFLLEFDADGQVVVFTLTISEILNNAPDIVIEASEVARFASVAYADILLSDVDGDEVTFEAQLIGADGVAEISGVKDNEVRIEVSLEAALGAQFILKVNATDSFGLTAELEHAYTVERQSYLEGRLLNKTPTLNDPHLVDTGDSCIMFTEYSEQEKLDGSNEYHVYDKATQTWKAQAMSGSNDHYILDVESAGGVTVWGGFINKVAGSEEIFSPNRAGFIEDGKLVNFPTLPAISNWNSNGIVQEVLPFFTAAGDLRIFISIRGEGVFVTDDMGETWAVVFMDEYMGFTADRIIGRNGLILMHGKAANQYGYFEDYQLISNDSGSTWSESSIYTSYSSLYFADVEFDPASGLYVAVGDPSLYESGESSPGLLSSSDGINWEVGNRLPILVDGLDPNEVTFFSVDFSNGAWIAVGNAGDLPVIVQSMDGVAWQLVNIGNELNASVASVSDCTGQSNVFLNDGSILTFDDVTGEYLLTDEKANVTAWVSPADGSLGLTAYVQEYSIDNGDYVAEGAFSYQSDDASNWSESQLLIDGNATASSLYLEIILQESRDKWLMFGEDNAWSSDDGINFNAVGFSQELPEGYPTPYQGAFENESFNISAGVISDILVDVDFEVWEITLTSKGYGVQSLGNIKDVISDATVADLKMISFVVNNRFYMVVDQVQGEDTVSQLIQYSPEAGLTLEDGCWFNEACLYGELNSVDQLILPINDDHFVLFSYDYSDEIFFTAVAYNKMLDDHWSALDITYERSGGSEIGGYYMPTVIEKTSFNPYIVSVNGVGMMVYDDEAGTMTGPLTIGGKLIDSVSRNGDQFVVKAGSFSEPTAFVLPLDAFSDIELSELPAPEMIDVPRPIVNIPR
jgi:hypothetical protein